MPTSHQGEGGPPPSKLDSLFSCTQGQILFVLPCALNAQSLLDALNNTHYEFPFTLEDLSVPCKHQTGFGRRLERWLRG